MEICLLKWFSVSKTLLNIVCNTVVIKHKNRKQKHHEWILNISYSELLSMKCACWNPIKLYKYKQYPNIMKMKEIDWNWKILGENEWLQKSGIKDHFKEFTWTQISRHQFMKMWKQNEGIIFNTINWLHSNTSILMYTER